MPINYRLINAVREGKLEKARELIYSYGLSYSIAWSEGYVLLRDAVENNHTEVVELLLANGSKVNSKNDKPTDTPLHFAVKNGNIEIVMMLLDNDANIFAKNRTGRTPFYNAIESNKIEVIQLLLKHGATVNEIDNHGTYPLHIAVKKKSLKMVELLLENGAWVDYECTSRGPHKGYTSLHFAVENCSKEIITLLLSSGANVNLKAENNITPLHIAAEKGCMHIAEELLSHGASINSSTLETNKNNLTPLHIATKRGHETIVKLLLQHGAKVDNEDKDGKTILHLAVKSGNLMIVENVLKYCPDVNNQSNRNSLKTAVHGNTKEIVQILLEYGLNVNPEDTNDAELLHAAVRKGYLKIVEDLLKYGADVNMLYNTTFEKGFTPIHSATKYKQDVIAKLLISYEADINAQDKSGKTPIFYAIENADIKMTELLLANNISVKDNPELLNLAVNKKCIKIIEILLQHDVDVNASDAYGRTALFFNSCSNSYLLYHNDYDIISIQDLDIKGEIAELLLSKGANVNAQTKNGQTTLNIAIKNEYVKVVEALLKYNANLNSAVKVLPLHLSAQIGNEEIIRMLLNKGADVNAKHMNGMTALHIASLKNYREVIKILLKYGSDINAQDDYGRTALHLASEKGHENIVKALRKYGSDINVLSRNNHTPFDHAVAGKNSKLRFCGYDDDEDFLEFDSFDNVCKALDRHIVKMKTANLYINNENLLSHFGKELYFQNKCEEEIKKMKSEKINNANISFYDFLARDTSSLAYYMRNKNVVQILKSHGYKSKFPIYASMIKSYFRKVMKRKELLDQVNEIIYFLFNNLPELPDACTDKILSYLSDEDLRIIMDAYNKPHSISNPNP